MNEFRADLHIHSVLSPCGDLEMSPGRIVEEAAKKRLDMIAICDHNHCGHGPLARKLGEKAGIRVLYGAEMNTREEVHCLAFFETDEQLFAFQEEMDAALPKVPNDPKLFGYQVLVDEQEMILEEVEHSLFPGLDWTIDQACGRVHELGGLFVPAHVDRRMNGLFSQLGFLPDDLKADAMEVSWRTTTGAMLEEHPELAAFTLIQSSDAHYPDDIGRVHTTFRMKNRSLEELSLALNAESGRSVSTSGK